jgi:hypothetical protein
MTRIAGTSYFLGLAALTASVACGTNATSGATPSTAPIAAPTQTIAAAPQTNGSPVVVSCEPNQRTLVRPVVVNGATLSQIECVTSAGTIATIAPPIAAPVYATPSAATYQPVRVAQAIPVSDEYSDTRVIAPRRTSAVVRPAVQTRQVLYREPVRKRSVKKSAVIIGSSAGVGAGVGAAVGGKKGALIGALIGGGGATLWDQITRRQ